MRVIPKPTERSLREHQTATTAAAAEVLTKKRLEAGHARQRALATVLGHGCAFCWGRQDIRSGKDGESILVCPILTEAAEGLDVRPEVLKAAKGCKIPGLYGRVAAGERQDITAEDVLKLVPRISEDGDRETLREADPEAAQQAGEHQGG